LEQVALEVDMKLVDNDVDKGKGSEDMDNAKDYKNVGKKVGEKIQVGELDDETDYMRIGLN
jgi:hypothetical protein